MPHARHLVWFLLPAAALLVVALLLPLCATLWISLKPNVLVQFDGPGAANYKYLLGKAYYIDVIWRTVRLAGEATVVALAIGYPAALTMRGLSERAAGTLALGMTLPVLAGPLVVVLGWMILLSDGGPLFQPLRQWGLPRPGLLGSEAGILVGMTHFLLPFVVLSLASVLRAIPDPLIEAARSLGASPWQRFTAVILPLSLPGVLSAVLIAFSLATGAYITPHYLGGVADLTLTMLVTQFVLATFNAELAAAASMVLLLLVAIATFALAFTLSRWTRG